MLPHHSMLGSSLVLMLSLTGCTPEAIPRPAGPAAPTAPSVAPTVAAASNAATQPALASTDGPAVPRPKRPPPMVTLTRVDGADAARTRAIFAPLKESLKECSPGTSGAMQVEVRRTADHTKMNISPGASLDPLARRCALESLSTVDTDGVLERGSPANRPSGFSALIRIEW